MTDGQTGGRTAAAATTEPGTDVLTNMANADHVGFAEEQQQQQQQQQSPSSTTRSFNLKQMSCTSVSTFEYTWENVTTAFWRKYHPSNPFVSHVEGYDVISREVDPVTKRLTTVRLVLKRGVLPKWGQFLLSSPQAFVIEISEVDPVNKTMTTMTRNLNHTRLMSVIERQSFVLHPDNNAWTQTTTHARVISQLGWGLKSRVEQFGVSRFQSSTEKSRKALLHTLEVLKKLKQLSPATAGHF